MQFVTFYTLTGKRTRKRSAKLLKLFGERGAVSGTSAHYVYADGGGGFLIGDDSTLEGLYEAAIAYSPWMELSTRPILPVEESVPISATWANS